MSSDAMGTEAGTTREPATDAEPGKPRFVRVWVVRADGGKYAEHFVAGGYAGTGSLDISSAEDAAEIRRRLEQTYPQASAARTSNHLGQLASFRFRVREGDYVITPATDRGRLFHGRVTGPCLASTGDDGCRFRNRRAVAWSKRPLGRQHLSESFQNALRSAKSVFEVSQRAEFLSAIGQTGVLPGPHDGVETDQKGEGEAVDAHEQGPRQAREDAGSERGIGSETDAGVEIEREDPEAVIERPFDPSKIKVHTVPITVDLLMSRIGYGDIDLAPDFQRMSGIWNAEKKSRLIESLLLRIPIPVFYVAADEEEKWAVVDGVQRLSTIRDYVRGEFALTRLEYRNELDGRRFDDLPRAMQRRISETQFVVNVIQPGTPPEVMFNIFRRINTGGMPLNGQEIRHALNPGPVRAYLKALAESDEFAEATDRSISPNRMDDRACVLRFLAFHFVPWEEYVGGSLESHLETAMKAINAMVPERRNALAEDFRKAMRGAVRIFGNDAFRRRFRPEDGRRPISVALFEAWSVQLARCTPEQIDRLAARRKDVQGRFMGLLNDDPEFDKAISVSTGTRRRIRKRFAAIRDLVQDLVRC